MPDTLWLEHQAELSLTRLLPRLETTFRKKAKADPANWHAFTSRLRANFENLFELLFHLYGSQYDFFYHLEQILTTAARMWLARPAELKALEPIRKIAGRAPTPGAPAAWEPPLLGYSDRLLDERRERDPLWFQSQHMVGGVCYVDLFAGDLNGFRQKISYFKELGLTYLHLMPLFLSPEKENDGGYAVSSYREVNSARCNG